MFKTDRILLASHGTTGARAAERAALELCRPGAMLLHLCVVPDLWRGMMGDDWLNNASTRAAYGRYVEAQLAREIDQHREALEREFTERGARYEIRVMLGRPERCLLEYAAAVAPDLAVIGAPRPPGEPGLRSRMHVEKLLRGLAAPLLIVPYPK